MPDRQSSSSRFESIRVRILVADDFPEWRAEIRHILKVRPQWQIIAEACDGVESLEKATQLRPDVILLDIGMPHLSGLEAVKRIKQASPDSKIIFVTLDSSDGAMRAALAVGANGYVLKPNAATELIPAIAAALREGHYRK